MSRRAFSFDMSDFEQAFGDMQTLKGALWAAYARAARGEGGDAVASAMRNNAPRRSGLFASSIDKRLRGARGLDIGTHRYDSGMTHPVDARSRNGKPGMRYSSIGWWVESGTQPHSITFTTPRGKRTVQHPGMRGRRVASRAITQTRWEVEAATMDELHTGVGQVRGFQ
jgi:hypothetical protein